MHINSNIVYMFPNKSINKRTQVGSFWWQHLIGRMHFQTKISTNFQLLWTLEKRKINSTWFRASCTQKSYAISNPNTFFLAKIVLCDVVYHNFEAKNIFTRSHWNCCFAHRYCSPVKVQVLCYWELHSVIYLCSLAKIILFSNYQVSCSHLGIFFSSTITSVFCSNKLTVNRKIYKTPKRSSSVHFHPKYWVTPYWCWFHMNIYLIVQISGCPIISKFQKIANSDRFVLLNILHLACTTCRSITLSGRVNASWFQSLT